MNVEIIMNIITTIIVPIMFWYIKYNESSKKELVKKLDKILDKTDVEKLIDLKMKVHNVEIIGIKDDLQKIDIKLDKILDSMQKNK